uniref:Penicillin-binding protein 2 n=1 Tax=candidate division WOR-3 bacterium TaxID=2052148 RepID=A0A7C3YT11_UNCW3
MRKVKVIFWTFSGFSFLLLLRLFYLQVLSGSRYSQFANFQSIRRIILTAPRGKIFDQRGRVLADVKPSFSLSVLPRELDSFAQKELEKYFAWDKNILVGQEASYSPVEIINNIPKEKALELEEALSGLRGIRLEVKPIRFYPYPFLFHVLGQVNKVSYEEWQRDKSYERSDFIGRQGLERWYEKILRGINGCRLVEVDARGREIGNLPEVKEIKPIAGCDLYLSLDLDLFFLADSLFRPYQRGACVAIDPRDGRVLLLYSKPYINPNLFLSSIPQEVWERVKNNPQKPLFNRVTQAQFPPGSTLKPLIALSGLKKGILTKNTRFSPCEGGLKFGNRYFRCWTAHGSLNLIQAIAQSCNTYFYQLGRAIGLEDIIKTASEFPFGKKTGIELTEEEGFLPTPEYLNRKYKGQVPKGIVLNLAIGQGEILVTPLQLALFYCAIARKGEFFLPHLVDSIKFPCGVYHPPFLDSLPFAPLERDGETTYVALRQSQRINLPKEFFQIIDDALEMAVSQGTGRGAYLSEVAVCGKTGTAQNPFGLDHSWFVGYAPKDTPSIVVCVLVENVGKGGAHSAPIAGRIIQRYFSLRRETTNRPENRCGP